MSAILCSCAHRTDNWQVRRSRYRRQFAKHGVRVEIPEDKDKFLAWEFQGLTSGML